jgi:hypothetical protein
MMDQNPYHSNPMPAEALNELNKIGVWQLIQTTGIFAAAIGVPIVAVRILVYFTLHFPLNLLLLAVCYPIFAIMLAKAIDQRFRKMRLFYYIIVVLMTLLLLLLIILLLVIIAGLKNLSPSENPNRDWDPERTDGRSNLVFSNCSLGRSVDPTVDLYRGKSV